MFSGCYVHFVVWVYYVLTYSDNKLYIYIKLLLQKFIYIPLPHFKIQIFSIWVIFKILGWELDLIENCSGKKSLD